MKSGKSTEKYNGWKNYETWNVHLWLTGDETLYAIYMESVRKGLSYVGLQYLLLDAGHSETPDGVSYGSPSIAHREISKAMAGEADYGAAVEKSAARKKK